ncbi:hypothetical protein BJX65DRAFT_279975 [Aspergillus insuetus]
MDHLLVVRNPRLPIEVPFFGLDTYDNRGFFSYPDRRGWDPHLLLRGDYGGRSALEAASFAQAWLYFGTLSGVTGIPIRGTNFIRVATNGQLLVTSQHLPFYLQRWQREVMDQDKGSPRWKLSLQKAKVHMEFTIQFTYSSSRDVIIPEVPEVAVSIEMLLVELVRVSTTIYGDEWWSGSTAGPFNSFKAPRWSPGTNLKVIHHLTRRMVSHGWCRHRLESLGTYMDSTCLYVLGLLGTDQLLEGHASCSESVCIRNQVDDSTYNDTPRHVIPGCRCDFIRVDISKTIEIIEGGNIPLATIIISEDNRVRLDMTPYKPGMNFIAISHVWSHGLGNPDENALRECQLEKLQLLVNGCDGDSENRDCVYFWLDTLCLPLRPKIWRKIAMRDMRQCYANASIVLVLDKHLQESSSQALATELLLRIAISDWRFRVWTLQEGFFAKRLMFQFLETAIDGAALWGDYLGTARANPRDAIAVFIALHVAPALGLELYEPGKRGKHQTGEGLSIATLTSSLRGRAISKPEDEPLCAASLLRQDKLLATLLETPKQNRMMVFWRSQSSVPSWVAFVNGPRLTEPGYQWALSSLSWPGISIEGKADDHGSLVPGGLQFTKPGLVLRAGEIVEVGTSKYAIGLVDEMGSRYYMARSPDKINPPLPSVHDRMPMAVVVIEWEGENHDPLALLVEVMKDGPDIHCRGLCRGIFVSEKRFSRQVFSDPVSIYQARRTRDDQSWILQ